MTTTYTTNNISTTTSIDFGAIVNAYESNEGYRHDFNEIFSRIASFLYWDEISACQRSGITSRTEGFVAKNMTNYLESAEYVRNRIHVALAKVIRLSCRLNCVIARQGGERFLMTRFKKDESGMYDILDAMTLANDIANAYEEATGLSMTETRWDMK